MLRLDDRETVNAPAIGTATSSTSWVPFGSRAAPIALKEWRTGASLLRQSITLSFETRRPSISMKTLPAAPMPSGEYVPSVWTKTESVGPG